MRSGARKVATAAVPARPTRICIVRFAQQAVRVRQRKLERTDAGIGMHQQGMTPLYAQSLRQGLGEPRQRIDAACCWPRGRHGHGYLIVG
jgi:hypothetical protein